jgi:hypothetical protein
MEGPQKVALWHRAIFLQNFGMCAKSAQKSAQKREFWKCSQKS